MWWSAFWNQYKAGGYLNFMLHPFVSGRASRVDMLERLIISPFYRLTQMLTRVDRWLCDIVIRRQPSWWSQNGEHADE